MSITKISDRGLDFIERWEGFVSRAYKDPVGVVTIGTGFTNASKVAKKYLGPIKLGMTITKEQNDKILREAVDTEYGPLVVKALNPKFQNQLDAADSFTFNVGPGGLKWKWAQAFRTGNVATAARLLRTTATTATGRKLQGLVLRRAAEARLLETGLYGDEKTPTFHPTPTVATKSDPILAQLQDILKDKGFYKGKVDGRTGPLTTAAVEQFQKQHPQLKVDGVLGKATITAIERTLDYKDKTTNQTAPAAISGAIASSVAAAYFTDKTEWMVTAGIVGAIVFVVVGVLLLAYRYRDELKVLKAKKDD